MKRNYIFVVIILILVVTVAFIVFGEDNNEVSSVSSISPQNTVLNTALSSNSPVEAAQVSIYASSNIDYRKLGQSLVLETLTNMFGGYDSSDFIHTLGDPEKKEDMSYFYRWYFKQGIEIDVFKVADHPEITHYIYFSNECKLSTDKNIGIGSTYDQVIQAYKDDINIQYTNTNMITAGLPEMGIIFFLKDKQVSSIYLALDETSTEYFRASDTSVTPEELWDSWSGDYEFSESNTAGQRLSYPTENTSRN